MNATDKMAEFVSSTRYEELPDELAREMKRVILDSIGCALLGNATGIRKISVALAEKLGGPGESSIIGTNSKVSCANAAFANGELINSLDFDARSQMGGHDVPTVISSILSLAEKVGASGSDLILAVALGLEISGRIQSGMGDIIAVDPEEGKIPWPEVVGHSAATLGAAAGAGKILGLDKERLANAIAVAGYICPPNTARKFFDTTPVRMSKYGLHGWGAQGGVTASLLAEMGYEGDTDLFEGDHGFWRYIGKNRGEWSTERTLEGIGIKWLTNINYKQYPCGYCIAGALDKFIQIIEKNDLQPEDITSVKAQPHPLVQFNFRTGNKLTSQDDYMANGLYLMACAVHRINTSRWHDQDVKQDPKIKKFMEELDYTVVVDEKDFVRSKSEDPRNYQSRIEVVAKGKTFREEAPHPKGGWFSEELRNTDEELVKKFFDNASKIISPDKARSAAQKILDLEKMEKISDMMNMVTL